MVDDPPGHAMASPGTPSGPQRAHPPHGHEAGVAEGPVERVAHQERPRAREPFGDQPEVDIAQTLVISPLTSPIAAASPLRTVSAASPAPATAARSARGRGRVACPHLP